jgi:hypothetical protein
MAASVKGTRQPGETRPSSSMTRQAVPTTTTSGRASRQAACSASRSGSATSSASMRAISSPRATAKPRLSARVRPMFSPSVTTRRRASPAAASANIAAVASVEPSSTAINSKSRQDWPRMLRRASAR